MIGGGFSGATFATLLLREPALAAYEISIIEPRPILGAGIAYSAADPLHRVNISAERMAALPDAVTDFDAWVGQTGLLEKDPAAFYPERGVFPARAQFGLYIDDLLRRTAASVPRARLRHLQTRVEAARRTGNRYHLECVSGEAIDADILVLATGHPTPRLPWPLVGLPAHPGLIVNPWQTGAIAQIGRSDRVLIIGTGLTMGDMIASLRQQGHQAPLTALSRRGLTPRPRASDLNPIEDLSFLGKGQVSQVLQAIRQASRAAVAAGQSWSDVFDVVRQQNGAIWTGWSFEAQRRFQRHLRPYWDVHRFQAAPQIHDLVTREQATCGLTIFAAAMTGAAIRGQQIEVAFRRRGQSLIENACFDAIINCTGATGPLIADSALLTSLAEAGLIRADRLGTGIDVDEMSHAKTTDGMLNHNLFVLGPAIRGCLGEISGALEIATHAQTVAKAVAALLNEENALAS